MGLLDSLLGRQAQMPGTASQNPLASLLDPSVALPIAAQLMGNQGNMANIGNAFAAAGPALQQRAQTNKTLDYLRAQAPEYAAMIDAGMPATEALGLYARQRQQTKVNPFDQRAEAARQYGLDPSSVEGRNYILSGDLPEARGGAAELGLNPQYGIDEQGNPTLIQIGKDGKAVRTQMPDGVTLSKAPIKLDAGTHYILLDPITRQPVGQVEKNLAEAEVQRAAGKAEGEDLATFRSMASKMPGLERVVSDLDALAEKGTYTWAGQALDASRRQLGMEPSEGAVARSQYVAMVDNQILPLLRDTFGAQFTQREGETLRATLGDPDKSPKEKQAILRAFIEQKRRDVEALATRTGQTGYSAPSGATGGAADPLGIR